MKHFSCIAVLLAFAMQVHSAVFNPFLNQISDLYDGKLSFTAEQKNSVLKSFAFGTVLPSRVLVVGKGDPSALMKYGGKVQTRTLNYFTAFVPLNALDAIRRESEIKFLNYEPRVQKYMDNAYPYVDANQSAAAGYKGDDVIVGVVDTGIDVKHQDFKTENGLSRILYLWDQNVYGTIPYGFDYGAEYTKYDIDNGNCPEYDEEFHGTHVTGIAAGNGNRSSGSYKGISPRANIIFVKLNFDSMGYLLDAVSYIINKARTLNRPCVINLSLGNQSGSHTEYDDFNLAMDDVVNYYGTRGHIIVWAAGNDGTGQGHIQTNSIGANTTVNVNYGQSPAYLFFWYTNSSLTFRIRNQVPATVVDWTNSGVVSTLSGTGVSVQCGANDSGEKYIYISITGTTGTWRIDFTNDSTAGQINGYVANVSSYNYFNNYSTNGTLSGQASQSLAISVGAMVTKTNYTDINNTVHYYPTYTVGDLAYFSSHGPSRNGKNKPEVVAPGAYIVSVYASTPGYSLLSSEKVNEYYAAMQGTSMAAPVVTGIIAQMLEKETNLTVSDIQQRFQNYTKLNSVKTSRTWDAAFGYGIADLSFLTTVDAAQARLDVSLKNNVMNVTQDKDTQLYILFRSNSSQIGKTVRAAVYDKNGGLVRDFGSTRVNQIAVKEYVWNGKDQFSRTVRPGLYFVQITLDNDTSRYPVLVVR